MSRVSIRYKEKTNGMKSVYLQFYPGIRNSKGEIVKYEFLNLEVYSNPKTKDQRLFNKTIEEISESIRCQRYIQIVRRDYNFLGKDNLDGDFLEYFHRNADFHGPKFEAARLHFEEFCGHSCKFRDLSQSFCEKYRYYILHDKHLTNNNKSIKRNTASSYFNVFLNIVKLAFKDNIIPHDYTSDIRPIKWNHDTCKDYLTDEEVMMLEHVKYEKYPQIPQACLFSIYTGLRRSDILDLKWEHFVRRGNHVYIEKYIVKTGMFARLPLSKDALRIISKRKKEGTVFTELTISILNIHVKYEKYPQIPQASLFSIYTGLRRSDILDLKWEHFVRRGNHVYIEKYIVKTGMFVRLPLSKDALRIIGKRRKEGTVFTELTISILNIHVKKWLESAGIKKHITFHCFRHTYAMMLTEKGISINVISALLCHKKLSSTQIYSKVTRQMTEEAIEKANIMGINKQRKGKSTISPELAL